MEQPKRLLTDSSTSAFSNFSFTGNLPAASKTETTDLSVAAGVLATIMTGGQEDENHQRRHRLV